MSDADHVNQALTENAAGPKRVQVANQSVEQHSLKEQIEAAHHVAGQQAKSRSDLGIRTRAITPRYP